MALHRRFADHRQRCTVARGRVRGTDRGKITRKLRVRDAHLALCLALVNDVAMSGLAVSFGVRF